MRAVSISNLSFSYTKTPILQNIGLQIPQGEFLGIIGPNGGGKTTLFKLIMGLLTPDTGTILLFDHPPLPMRTRIGYVPQASQTDRAFPITVLELVLLGCVKNQFSYPPCAKEKAMQLIEELGLAPYQAKAFSSLSGGLAQRALLARALISDPDLLLLDEPTANIDPYSRAAILDRLERLKGTKTILLVTHDLRTIIEKVDKILCVQTQITSYLPKDLCEHFAFGLYHTPLLSPMSPDVYPHISS